MKHEENGSYFSGIFSPNPDIRLVSGIMEIENQDSYRGLVRFGRSAYPYLKWYVWRQWLLVAMLALDFKKLHIGYFFIFLLEARWSSKFAKANFGTKPRVKGRKKTNEKVPNESKGIADGNFLRN
ncbi:hypothetical protein NPIL_558841 [Nephila pilipes]|uniref:Uncharacterized protein n=1 Tax=Nephila pilipes TaxID=299642 RepID=A0A8X6QDY0_NEPPI|nr:hypothetical protein NPIL_558841 [Nephila pilipes]